MDKLSRLLVELYTTPLPRTFQHVDGVPDVENIELAVRQYLLFRFSNVKINSKILSCLPERELNTCLPPDWFPILEGNGFAVNRVGCRIKWLGYLLALIFYGIFVAAREVYYAIAFRDFVAEKLDQSVMFVGYRKNLLLDNQYIISENNQKTIISWYAKWDGRPPEISQAVSQAKGNSSLYRNGFRYKTMPFDGVPLPFLSALNLLTWTIIHGVGAIFSLVRGKWWNAFMLHEVVLVKKMEFTSDQCMPKQYLFDHSACSYKPLWAYTAEKRGAECIVYFYSTNSAGFVDKNNIRFHFPAFYIMNWSRYLVWSEEHRDFMADIHRNNQIPSFPNFQNVGPIPFEDSGLMLGAVSEPAIAIFDVSPVRDALYWPLGVNVEYYVPSVVNRFLEDVYDAANALGITVLYKRKRDHKRFHHPKYERQCASMRQRTGWHEVEASISAFRVIDMVDMVISLPFTSTALIGVAQGKPSIYYDPTGEMCTDDRAALGVPIVTNKDDLRNWMEETLLDLSY